tara:strand:- start:1013 stop:1486 length:474 start_codon:yes stop_codon:yes gene_type:complete
MSFKHNDGHLDFADWLITEGYGTPYRVRVDGFTDRNDHFMITALSKSVMAVRLTYFTKHQDATKEDMSVFGDRWFNKEMNRKEKIYSVRYHKVDIEYLAETGWLRFARFDTSVLPEKVLEGVGSVETNNHRLALERFEAKVKALLDHVITFHGLTLQ